MVCPYPNKSSVHSQAVVCSLFVPTVKQARFSQSSAFFRIVQILYLKYVPTVLIIGISLFEWQYDTRLSSGKIDHSVHRLESCPPHASHPIRFLMVFARDKGGLFHHSVTPLPIRNAQLSHAQHGCRIKLHRLLVSPLLPCSDSLLVPHDSPGVAALEPGVFTTARVLQVITNDNHYFKALVPWDHRLFII